mmetsp:Transcript_64512/g.144122  ORF Transcript_64512/g.144122 Transcript_64512/m.144122 type:complete len:206 (+) Transcript_64512:126-743(+)
MVVTSPRRSTRCSPTLRHNRAAARPPVQSRPARYKLPAACGLQLPLHIRWRCDCKRGQWQTGRSWRGGGGWSPFHCAGMGLPPTDRLLRSCSLRPPRPSITPPTAIPHRLHPRHKRIRLSSTSDPGRIRLGAAGMPAHAVRRRGAEPRPSGGALLPASRCGGSSPSGDRPCPIRVVTGGGPAWTVADETKAAGGGYALPFAPPAA